jgi:glucan endo-1,3-alpha-glucosidase
MAPVVTTLLAVLALSGMSEAKPLLSPGRHAPPVVANALAGSRRSFHSMIARYYGTAHGLVSGLPANNLLLTVEYRHAHLS